MSNSNDAPVFIFNNEEPKMQRAIEKARETFGFFWREIAWNRRRIIPALDMACVKAPFFDPPESGNMDEVEAEQMWLTDVDFDGRDIKGTLMNSPRWVKSVSEGDEVSVPLAQISDWMYVYVTDNTVYGGYTVNAIRESMSPDERAQHDDAWGLNFPEDPTRTIVYRDDYGTDAEAADDHPMGRNMGDSLAEYLSQDPNRANERDDDGWTFLHRQALAGSRNCVSVLLEHGADRTLETPHGMTALQLAESLNWKRTVDLLQ